MEEVNYGNELICRACLKIIEQKIESFGYIEDATGNLRDMLMCCIPELDIYVSSNPIICFTCIQSLVLVHNFKSKCIHTENIIRTFMKKYNLSDQNPINLSSVIRDYIEVNSVQIKQAEIYQMEQSKLAAALQHPGPPPPLQPIGVQILSETSVPAHYVQQPIPANSCVSDNGNLTQIVPLTDCIKSDINDLKNNQTVNNKPLIYNTSSANSTNKFNESASVEIKSNEELNTKESSTNKKYKSTDEVNKGYIHPIERKARLIVRIPRSNLIIPTKKNVEKYSHIHNENSNSNGTNEDPEIIAQAPTVDTDHEMENFDEKMKFDEEEIVFNNDGLISSNHITKFYNCSCMYLTTSPSLYQEHKRKCKTAKLTSKYVHKCPHCPHVTNRSYALNKHINTMHTKAVWFMCDFCTYRSTDKACLRRHVRKNHEQGAPKDRPRSFNCTVCDMVISSEYNFNRHMLKHEETVLSTYNCDFCSYQCKDRSNFRKHVFTHSPELLQCPSCSYSNVSPYCLKSHIKRNHDGVGIEVADCKSEITVYELIKEIKALRDGKDNCMVDQHIDEQVEESPESQELQEHSLLDGFMENHDIFDNPEISRFIENHDLFMTQGIGSFIDNQELVETN